MAQKRHPAVASGTLAMPINISASSLGVRGTPGHRPLRLLKHSRGTAVEFRRAIQLVDEQGRVRSELKVLPAGTANGVQHEETVIFRLVTADGKPRVKLTTSNDGSSLLLLGSSDDTYARVGSTKIDLVDGAKTRTFTP
jgi:hypothetical protein